MSHEIDFYYKIINLTEKELVDMEKLLFDKLCTATESYNFVLGLGKESAFYTEVQNEVFVNLLLARTAMIEKKCTLPVRAITELITSTVALKETLKKM